MITEFDAGTSLTLFTAREAELHAEARRERRAGRLSRQMPIGRLRAWLRHVVTGSEDNATKRNSASP